MSRLLVAGDFHIPFRASRLPEGLLKMLEKERFDKVIITGDLVQLYVLKPFEKFPIIAVRGNMDIEDAAQLPEVAVFQLPDFNHKLVVFHGTGIRPRGEPMLLRAKALKHGGKVIFTGHTHYPEARKVIDVIIVNPGSGTGVIGGCGGFGKPTWSVVELSGDDVSVIIYKAVEDDYDVLREVSFEF